MRFFLFLAALPLLSADADLILHNGKIVTADARFTVVEAIAIKAGKITRTGASSAILAAEKGPRTNVVDLAGKTVLPGLIDAHVHAIGAGLSEFKSKLPPLDSIADIQNYIEIEKAIKDASGIDADLQLVDDSTVNAFAGYADKKPTVAVTFGLLDAVNPTDAEFAALLGHEFAHFALRHYESVAGVAKARHFGCADAVS